MVGRKGNLSEVPKGIRFQMLRTDITEATHVTVQLLSKMHFTLANDSTVHKLCRLLLVSYIYIIYTTTHLLTVQQKLFTR